MPKKILIVDDSTVNRRILAGLLHTEYDVLEAENGQEALDVLQRSHPVISAVLLDIRMPEPDGFEVLRRIRENPVYAHLPVIMLTGSDEQDARVKSLALGANDFIQKPYNPAIIRHCLRNNIAFRESASIINAIQHDKLTGLYTREAFFEKARILIRDQEPGYYIMASFDVNNFKYINDQFGAAEGDRILKFIGQGLLEDMERTNGIGCRIAADNFAALYPAHEAGDRLFQAVSSLRDAPEPLLASTAFSVGRCVVNDPSLSAAALYDRAYLAKQSVKGRYDAHIAYFDESMRDGLLLEQQILSDMDAALANRQFEVWYQPQYNHSTGALVGAEALVRWRHPQKGLLPPGVFIPIFERNGFIYALDQFVWEEVAKNLRAWLDAGRKPLSVSVNISRYDALRAELPNVFTALAERYRLPAGLMRLEITESALSESAEQIASTVTRLLESGFTIEIDDFGSGYSSLNTLKDVPAQALKLDMKFLESDNGSQRGGNIVESIVRMAKWLGMSVIAEGVETVEQADFLRSIGCNYVQGYLYARPMPLADYEALAADAKKERRVRALETVENLDNNAFWDPASMDTLIFNSYVGGACIYEYCRGRIELLRATEKYAQVIGSAGMTVADALKLNWREHLEAESARRVTANIERSRADKREITDEYLFLDLPGCPHETYLRSTLRVIATAGDRCLVYCMNENITAQRKAEEKERQATERMQAIMDDIGSGVTAAVRRDGALRFLFANDQFYEIHDCTREMFEGTESDPYAVIHPDDRQWTEQVAMEVYKTHAPATIEYRLRLPSGDERWVRVAMSTTRFMGVEEDVQLCIYNDITVQRTMEQAFRRASTELATMMDDIPGGFMRLRVGPNGQRTPTYLNNGFLRLTGMGYDSVVALYRDDPLAGVHPDDADLVQTALAELLKNGEASSPRYRLRHQNGGYVWLRFFGRVTEDLSGDTFLNIYYIDAAEQYAAEQQQREILDNLPYGAALYAFDGTSLTVEHMNRRYWTLVGREPTATGDITLMKSVHPGDRERARADILAAIENGDDVKSDVRIRYGADEYRYFHIVGRIVPRDKGRYSIYAVYTPVSDETLSIQEMLPVALEAVMASETEYTFVKDKSRRYVCCSRAFAKLVGLSDEKAVAGRTDIELFDAAIAEGYREDDRRVLESGESLVECTERIPSLNGTSRFVRMSKYALHDSRGNIIGLYGFGRDVTGTLEKQSQLKLLTDNIPGGIATYRYSGGRLSILYFNDGLCKMFNCTREEYERIGTEDALARLHPEDQEKLKAQIDRMVEAGEPLNCTCRISLKGNEVKWINLRAAVAESGGGTTDFNVVLFDVTEQQNGIELLRISEEENRLAVLLSGNIVCRYNVADRSLTTSPEAAERFGRSPRIDDVPYGPVALKKISPESEQAYIRFYEEILHGKRSGSGIFRMDTSEGWRWLEAHYSTVFSAAGEPVSAVVAFTDVTEQLEKEMVYKKWQQSFLKKNPKSYSMYRCNISKNTAFAGEEGSLLYFKITPESMTFDELAAQYARQYVFDEDRELFSAFLHSDAMLAGYYRGKRSDALDYRETLPDGGFRWLRLTVDLFEYPNSTDIEAYLLFENIDEGKRTELLTLERAENDALTGVLNRATFESRVNEILRNAKADAHHALFMLDIDGFKLVNDVFGHSTGDQTLIGIADALRSALRRGDLLGRFGGDEFLVFLSNLPDESAAAAKAKQICTITRKSFNLEVQISASIGIAVAPDDGASFETLYRKADAALYHVKGAGKDSYVFYRGGMEDKTVEQRELPARERERKRRILVVDDNGIDRGFMASIFQPEFTVEKAKDGNEALVRLRHYGSAISVVLLDLVMPGMDGFAVLDRMRMSAELQGIPVIVVSGDEHRDTCLRAITGGAADFVVKPIDAEVLKIRVRAAISRAENDRARAENNFQELANSEAARYKAVLERMGTVVIEQDWLSGRFTYDPAITQHIAGIYNDRKLWHILLADMVADAPTVKRMQEFIHQFAENRSQLEGSLRVKLKVPSGARHWFTMTVYKIANEFGLTDKLLLTFQESGREPGEA